MRKRRNNCKGDKVSGKVLGGQWCSGQEDRRRTWMRKEGKRKLSGREEEENEVV